MTDGPAIEIRLAEALRTAMTCGRIALFSAPCGFGRTVASRALLPGTEQCLRPADIKCLPGGGRRVLGCFSC